MCTEYAVWRLDQTAGWVCSIPKAVRAIGVAERKKNKIQTTTQLPVSDLPGDIRIVQSGCREKLTDPAYGRTWNKCAMGHVLISFREQVNPPAQGKFS